MIPMQKRLKNASGADRNWRGQTIVNGAYWDIPANEERKWAGDTDVHASITAGDLVVNDGTSDLGVADGIEWIKRLSAQCINAILIMDTAPADGEVLTYDSALGKWKPSPTAAGAAGSVYITMYENKIAEVGAVPSMLDTGPVSDTWKRWGTGIIGPIDSGHFVRSLLPITGYVSTTKFRVAGNKTAFFGKDTHFRVTGSTDNTGRFKKKNDAVYDGVNDWTVVETYETLIITTIDGSIETGVLTAQADSDGIYVASLDLSVDVNNINAHFGLFINGSLCVDAQTITHPPSSNEPLPVNITAHCVLAAGDEIDIRAKTDGTNKEFNLWYGGLTLWRIA